MSETARIILGLRSAGWTEKEINDFILYIETGEEHYKPARKNENNTAASKTNDSVRLW